MKALTDVEKGLLTIAITMRGWHLKPETIVPAGRLIELGLCTATNDYDGLQIAGTEKGEAFAARLGLIERAPPNAKHSFGWERTAAGQRLAAAVPI